MLMATDAMRAEVQIFFFAIQAALITSVSPFFTFLMMV
jgi:hypothetical protein